MEYGCVEMDHPFWSNSGIRSLLTKDRFEAHDCYHRKTCFKKGCECRFFFPHVPCKRTKIDADPEQGTIRWHKLVADEDIHSSPWLLVPRRPLGCEFINTHNHPMSEILNCNTNVQIGDPTQVLYSTLYSSKNTQKEDAERRQRIAGSIIRRLLREEQKIMLGKKDVMPSGFGEGISLLLSGINAATSRDVRSAPMAHLLVCQNGMRFMYSHGFCPLLVSQMEDKLENIPVTTKLRRSKKGGETILWADSSSDDYLHRPSSEQFNGMSFYEMTMNYKKSQLLEAFFCK
jgi:hypothetical protein